MAVRLANGLIGIAATGNTIVLAADNYVLSAVYINIYLLNGSGEARLRLRSGTTELIVKAVSSNASIRWVDADVQFAWADNLVLVRNNTINFDYFLDPTVTAFAWNYAIYGTIVP